MGIALVRKYGSIATLSCYRSAMRHPLLAFMVFLLIWMYRSFPVLFSLLVSASPVFVSTAVLLGTLLSFGHANVPQIQKQGKPHHHEIYNLRTRVMEDSEIDERPGCEESHGVSGVRDKAFGEKTFVVNDIDINDDDHRPPVKFDKLGRSVDNSELGINKQSRKEAKSEVGNQKTDVGEEKVVVVNRCSQPQLSEAKNSELRNSDKLQGGAVDPSQSAPGLLSKNVEKHRDEDDKGWETGSDLIESSSPSASMADIFPMLDELHPLLQPEVPQRTQTYNVSTDAASDHSVESTDIANETDDSDDDDQEDTEVKDDEEEEEANVDKEHETAITWTKDDQKNLVNFGTSELERNQCLDNLIARQRALKDMRMLAEKKMADLSPDLPFNTNLISTDRKNPFDVPYDSNESILGSAPPVMVPRRNPFDLPYDPRGVKPGTAGESFQSDSVAFQPNDPFCRRHESFDVGPSTLGASRQGREGFDLGPYFVPERTAPDGTSYSSMHRQEGELSDSKVSSTPDTESSDSADDLEHKSHTENDNSREADLTSAEERDHISEVNEHVRQRSWSSEDDDTVKLHQDAKGDGRLDEAKVSAGDETGYQEKTSSEWSSSPLSDVSDHIYNEKEDEKNLGSVPETNYVVDHGNSPEKSDMQLYVSKRHHSPPTRYAEDQHVVVPDNKEQLTVEASSHHKGASEEKIISRPEELSLTDRSPNKPLTQDSNGNSPDKSDVQLYVSKRHHSPPTRYAEDQHVVVPDNKEHLTVEASSHHKGASEEKIISRPEELSLTDRSPNKPLTQDSKELQIQEQEKEVSSNINSASTTKTPPSPTNSDSASTTKTPPSPTNIDSASTTKTPPSPTNINSASTTKTPPSPTNSTDLSRVETESVSTYTSDISRFETESVSSDLNRVETDSVSKSDIGNYSSAYYSGSNSDTEASENGYTDFATASESEMSRASERAFPQTLSQMQHDLTSWLTGWRA